MKTNRIGGFPPTGIPSSARTHGARLIPPAVIPARLKNSLRVIMAVFRFVVAS
jgi:hypothetical protein